MLLQITNPSVSMISFASDDTAQWSDTIPSQNVQLFMWNTSHIVSASTPSSMIHDSWHNWSVTCTKNANATRDTYAIIINHASHKVWQGTQQKMCGHHGLFLWGGNHKDMSNPPPSAGNPIWFRWWRALWPSNVSWCLCPWQLWAYIKSHWSTHHHGGQQSPT